MEATLVDFNETVPCCVGTNVLVSALVTGFTVAVGLTPTAVVFFQWVSTRGFTFWKVVFLALKRLKGAISKGVL